MNICNIEETRQFITTQIVSRFLSELSIYGYVMIEKSLGYNMSFIKSGKNYFLVIIIDNDYYDLIKNENLSDELKIEYKNIINQEIVFHKVLFEKIRK